MLPRVSADRDGLAAVELDELLERDRASARCGLQRELRAKLAEQAVPLPLLERLQKGPCVVEDLLPAGFRERPALRFDLECAGAVVRLQQLRERVPPERLAA